MKQKRANRSTPWIVIGHVHIMYIMKHKKINIIENCATKASLCECIFSYVYSENQWEVDRAKHIINIEMPFGLIGITHTIFD